MSPDEAGKAKKIQAILVRNYVSTDKLEIDVHQNAVDITGELQIKDFGTKIKDPTEVQAGVKRACLSIESEIRRTASVQEIYWRLRNWDKAGNRWTPKKS